MRTQKVLAALVLAALFVAVGCDKVSDNPLKEGGKAVERFTESAGKAAKTAVKKIDDKYIEGKIRAQLLSNKEFIDTDITIKSARGFVTLTGTAPTAKIKGKIYKLAKVTKGVRGVKSKITIAVKTEPVEPDTEGAGTK